MKTAYDQWSESPEDGCPDCGAPREHCDCLTCAECGAHLADEGAYRFSRLTPAVTCCSTSCLLAYASYKILTNCIEMLAMPPANQVQ